MLVFVCFLLFPPVCVITITLALVNTQILTQTYQLTSEHSHVIDHFRDVTKLIN